MVGNLKAFWSSLNRDSRRVILGIVTLTSILVVVVIATVSKSASIKEPKSDDIWTNIRLPSYVIPQSYDVKLRIDMTNERFSGSEDVVVELTSNTSVLVIHINDIYDPVESYEMNVTSYSVVKLEKQTDGSMKEVGSVRVKQGFPYTPNSFFVLKMKQTLDVGWYKLSFEWESRLVRGLEGIYLSTYNDSATGEERKLLASQMEPLAARKVMPCFDEPDFKANFSMEITSEDLYPLVLWNMPEKTEPVVSEPGWKTRVFEESVPMSTYLLAFIIADFECTSPRVTSTGVTVRTCGQRDAINEDEAGEYSAEATKIIIEAYEKFYDENFPLKKIDSVAVPDFSAGAMENWGLILYRETALLYTPSKDTLKNKARVSTVVAHELAHQWFGNLVTMKWWNDLWLNEGFASYVEWIGTNASEPEWKYLDFQTSYDRSAAFNVDSYASSRPTSIPVEKPSDITAQFDSISYSKGSALLVQAKMFMDQGDEDTQFFETAIRNYIKKHSFQNTEQKDLYQQLNLTYASRTDVDPIDIVSVMNTWTLQMNFPLISVAQYDDQHLMLSQERFLISGGHVTNDLPSDYGYQWYVPIEYTISNGKKEFVWLKPHSTVLVPFNFSDESASIHLNRDNAGYYITDYSYDTWSRFTGNIDQENVYQMLSVPEKQGMLFDTFQLISLGKKPITTGLNLIQQMINHNESMYVPLREINNRLGGIQTRIRGDTDLAEKWRNNWKKWAEDIYKKHSEPFFRQNNPLPLPKDGEYDEYENPFQKRMLISFGAQIACSVEVKDCLDAAKDKFEIYKKNESSLLPDFKTTVLNSVISDANITAAKENWQFLWEKYLNSKQATEKEVIYYALGLIRDAETLKTFSSYCLDSTKVRPSDALYIMGRSIAQTALGAEVSWEFMKSNWKTMGERFSNALFAVDAYISGVLSNFATEEKLNEIEDFFSNQTETLGAGLAAYRSALQSINANIAWLERHKPSIEDFIANNA